MKYDAIIIGAGLTGLTTAFYLRIKGLNILVLEKKDRVGGAICSHHDNGFIYEEGPNTGVVGNAMVGELFEQLCIEPAIAKSEAEKRLILKNSQWHPLPDGPVSFLKTPLFDITDKIKIAFEPLRKKGTDPDESVASLALRRIGKSFVDYAVNPFISGIYAGDPEKLTTRYALPKLYNLEQNYGSFIGGTYKMNREKKARGEKDFKYMRKVFSGERGFGTLIEALENNIGIDNIVCNAQNISVNKEEGQNGFKVSFTCNGNIVETFSPYVISTVGAYALPQILPFVRKSDMENITNLNYAKIIQVAVGVERNAIDNKYISFGGLIPQKENKRILGVLFPSFCFDNRAPKDCATLAIYLGGIRHPEYISLSDVEIKKLIEEELLHLFQISPNTITFMKIFRHQHAIPQYEKSSGKRFDTVAKLEAEYKGLIIAGNLRDGIGIADRIKQASQIAESIS